MFLIGGFVMIFANMYTKHLSEIKGGIQNKKTIWYGIHSQANSGTVNYGIHVLSYSKGRFEKEIIPNISVKKEFVKNLVKYLYENSVDVLYCRDIITDFI